MHSHLDNRSNLYSDSRAFILYCIYTTYCILRVLWLVSHYYFFFCVYVCVCICSVLNFFFLLSLHFIVPMMKYISCIASTHLKFICTVAIFSLLLMLLLLLLKCLCFICSQRDGGSFVTVLLLLLPLIISFNNAILNFTTLNAAATFFQWHISVVVVCVRYPTSLPRALYIIDKMSSCS